MIEKLIKKLNLTPQRLFLIDGLGALISAFLLGFVLTKLRGLLGIPINLLYFLTTFPTLFFFFDLYSYYKTSLKQKKLLKLIACANLFYCFLSLFTISNNFKTVTIYGASYILIEILIIIFLSLIELKVSKY